MTIRVERRIGRVNWDRGLQIVVGIIAGFTLFGSIDFVVPTRRLPWRALDLASGPKRPLAARHTR